MPAFEAEVTGLRTFVHAGPGVEFYPTQLLPRGEKVTVYGVKNGWAAIGPPKASFSWIPCDAVLEEDDGTGRVTADDVKLRIGSALSDASHVFQVTLNKGDRVTILDRAPLKRGNRMVEHFKVRPQRDELRYVAIENLDLPMPIIVKQQLAAAANSAAAGPGGPSIANGNPTMSGIPAAQPIGGDKSSSVLSPTSINQPFDPAVRPVTGQLIPPAQPLNRVDGSRGATESARPADPAAPPWTLRDDRMAPIDRRIASLRNQLDIMRSREPSQWKLDDADRILADLRQSARTDADKVAVQECQLLVRKLEETRDRYAKSVARFDAAMQRDMDLASRQVSRQTDVGRLNRRFAAEGTLRRPSMRIGDRQTVAVEDAKGAVTHYAVAPPGLDLEKHLGKKVGLLGQITRRPNVPVPIVEVEQVSHLNP